MRNHFHLLVSMRPMVVLNPSGLKDLKGFDKQSFSNFFNAYTKAINKSYQRTGSVFEKPFQRLLVDSDSYFVQLVSYIHRNPQKHGFVSDFRNYPYSSYSAIRFQKRSRVETQTTLSWFGNLQSYEFCHLQNDDKSIQHFVADD